MKSTLYVTDLDGTLLTPEESLSPFTVRVINRLVEQGVSFTYATARSLHSSSKVTQGLTKRLPVTHLQRGLCPPGGHRGKPDRPDLFPSPAEAGGAGLNPGGPFPPGVHSGR